MIPGRHSEPDDPSYSLKRALEDATADALANVLAEGEFRAMLIRDAEIGLKCRRKRGGSLSHYVTAGVLWVVSCQGSVGELCGVLQWRHWKKRRNLVLLITQNAGADDLAVQHVEDREQVVAVALGVR